MFFFILGIVAWTVFALWPAFIARRKGYSFALFFLLGVLVSFILALIVAGLIKDKTETAKDRADDAAVEQAMHKEEGIE
jgi:hypothetical protein